MADAITTQGQAPVEPASEPSLEAEVAEVFSFSETPLPAGDNPQGRSASASPVEAGDGVVAPSPSPDTPPAASEPSKPAAPTPATPTPQAATPPAGQEPSAVAATPSLQVDEGALKTASLEAQVQALQETIRQLQANPQGTPQQPGAQPQPAQPAAESGPPTVPSRYALTLPPPIVEALQSEDESVFVGAIGKILNDLATIVHHSVVTQVRGEVNGTLRELIGAGEQTQLVERQTNAVEEARQDYFNTFPEHKHPAVLPIIQAESAKLATEFPELKWGDQFRNALGTRVQGVIDGFRQPVIGDPQQTPVNPPPAKPAAMIPSGTRGSAAPGSEMDAGDLIIDTLGVFSEG